MYLDYFKNKKAVFFDLDGTIVDTDKLWEEAFLHVLDTIDINFYPIVNIERGIPLEESWNEVKSRSKAPFKIPIENLVEDTKKEYLKLLDQNELNDKEGYSSLSVELKELGYKRVLISNSNRVIVKKVLEKLEIEKNFDLIVTRDDVKKGKPSPDIYNFALNKLNLKPNEVIVFEDSVTGANASIKAGLDTIVISTRLIRDEEFPEEVLFIVPDFTQFVGNLEKDYYDTVKEYLEDPDVDKKYYNKVIKLS